MYTFVLLQLNTTKDCRYQSKRFLRRHQACTTKHGYNVSSVILLLEISDKDPTKLYHFMNVNEYIYVRNVRKDKGEWMNPNKI